MSLFGGVLLGGSNEKKRDDHRNKKFFINKSVKALIPLKEGHQSLLKLHVLLRGCSSVCVCVCVCVCVWEGREWGSKKEILFEVEK